MAYFNIVIINTIVTSFLTGLIWTIQLVHYPSFRFIANNDSHDFMIFHMKGITKIVAPLMILELIVAVYLLRYSYGLPTLINFSLVTLIWLSTYILSMPCHKMLFQNYDKDIIDRLVLTNWPRTILWTTKTILSSVIIFDILE